jgi:hypothetical protein
MCHRFFNANGVSGGVTTLPGIPTVTPGITADVLGIYRAVAVEAVDAGIDTVGVQSARIALIDLAIGGGL